MSLPAAIDRITQIQSAFTTLTPTPPPPRQAPAGGTTAFATTLANATTGGALAPPGTPLAATVAPATSPITPVAPVGLTGGTGPNAMVAIAQAELGQSEQPPGSDDSPRIAQYRQATPGAVVGPWCAYFVSWVSQQAGMPLGDSGGGFGWVPDVYAWAQRTGRAVPNGPGVVPRPGDLIVFSGHIGIVEKPLPDGSVQTIEGNHSDRVDRVVRGAGEAVGYVRMS